MSRRKSRNGSNSNSKGAGTAKTGVNKTDSLSLGKLRGQTPGEQNRNSSVEKTLERGQAEINRRAKATEERLKKAESRDTEGATNGRATTASVSDIAGKKEFVAYAVKVATANTALAGYELPGEEESHPDHVDMLDMYAVRLIDMLQGGIYSISILPRQDLCTLYRYFYRNNPILGRIIDIHTDIPLSKLNLTPPNNVSGLAKDYITQFYARMLKRVNLPEKVREMVIHHWVYGSCDILVSDHYEGERELQEPDPTQFKINPDELDLRKTEEAYDKDPNTVGLSDRKKYLESRFVDFWEESYQGPSSIRVIPFYEIEDYKENPDIRYRGFRAQTPESLRNIAEARVSVSDVVGLGYSKGLLQSMTESKLSDSSVFQCQDTFFIDNDHLTGNAFSFHLEKADGMSIIHRVLNECLAWDAAYKALKNKIASIGKVGRVITAPELSSDQVGFLRAEVETMIQDPDYAIVANYDINWDEVNAFIKEELAELADSTSGLQELLSNATGIPSSMISGDGSFSGDSIKLELINTSYASFKNQLAAAIEEGLFKPVALRKGFVSVDSWGNLELAYPKVSLSRVSLRDDAVTDMLFALYQKGSMNIGLLLELLNLDDDDVRRAVEKDLFTVNDPNFNEILRDIYSQAATDIYNNSDAINKIMTSLHLGKPLPLHSRATPPSQVDPKNGEVEEEEEAPSKEASRGLSELIRRSESSVQ